MYLPSQVYTKTLYVMVTGVKGDVRAHPTLTNRIDFSTMMECSQKVAIASLCVLCCRDLTVHVYALYRLTPGTCLSKMSTIPTAEQRKAEVVRNV